MNSHEAILAGKRQKNLETLRRYAVNQIDREEKEIKQCLTRLQEEREVFLQLDAMQGTAGFNWIRQYDLFPNQDLFRKKTFFSQNHDQWRCKRKIISPRKIVS